MAWDAGTGLDCTPGRLRVDIAFNEPSQFANIQLEMPAQDFKGHTLRAFLQIEGGFWSGDVSPGGAFLFVKTGPDSVRGSAPVKGLPSAGIRGGWTELTFGLDPLPNIVLPGGIDPTAVVAIGIQIFNNPEGTFGRPSPAVIYVDHITLD